jgi:hypothetical protein
MDKMGERISFQEINAMLKFSEFASDVKPMDGKKAKILDLLDKEITVIGFKIRNSSFNKGCGRYAALQTEYDGERFVSFTGSEVLIEQLEKYGDKIPFSTIIRQIDRFYTFS